MPLPALVYYETESEYREHFKRCYCRRPVYTSDGIRVYFDSHKFEHAFYEGGAKWEFSPVRAQRIDWVGATLAHPNSDLYQGFIKKINQYDPGRRVAVVFEDFVVVVGLSLGKDQKLKGKFVTCYQADRSIGKIRTSPEWTLETCLTHLEKGGKR